MHVIIKVEEVCIQIFKKFGRLLSWGSYFWRTYVQCSSGISCRPHERGYNTHASPRSIGYLPGSLDETS